MLWEYNKIKDKYGTSIAGLVRAFDGRLGVGLGAEDPVDVLMRTVLAIFRSFLHQRV